MVKVGDRVRVKPSVTTPKYKWGSVNHGSVGTVVSISPNGKDVKVDFPQQTNWTGLISEMEVVPATHPRTRSDNLSFWTLSFFWGGGGGEGGSEAEEWLGFPFLKRCRSSLS